MAESTERLSSALADRYQILSRLGEGGMATVYLAEDLKHKRQVAVKVLKPELAAVLGAERFVQEITTTASLQHPHILPLFDSGEADSFLYYVMPYIEGETLRAKLDRETQFGIEEAVKITADVADALDYAHRQGVIHRDIKPENILLHDGRPMVADFGIALAVSAAAGGRMTETGLSLGTPHYMSPEQATAEKDLSGRSDVYSLGTVLYEMLTGDPPHTGSSAQQIVMKIIADEARPITELRKSVPNNVAAAVAKSLEKLPADRFGSARELAEALGDTGFTTPGMPSGAVSITAQSGLVSRRRWQVALAANAILLAAVAAAWLRPGAEAVLSRQRVVLWQHSLGQFLSPGIQRYATQAAIAPDGSSIVFSDSVGGGVQLFRKLREEGTSTLLAGTEGGLSPFFSPDGRWIGYVTVDGKLRKVPVDGGNPLTLAEDAHPVNNSATWLDDNTIVYVGQEKIDLRSISADGGGASVVIEGTGEGEGTAHLSALPGSRGILFTRCPGNCAVSSSIEIIDFAADSGHELVPNAAGAWYSPTGHLLYTDRAGGLFAAEFDLDRLELTAGAIPVIDDVAPTSFALSASGSVLYSVGTDGGSESELVWVTRDGTATPLDSTWHGTFEYPALSPDGGALAVSLSDGSTQLWIRQSDGRRQQLTQDGTVNWRPFWTSDGRSVAFLSNRRGGQGPDNYDAYQMPVDGSTTPELLLRHTFGLWEVEFTTDGEWLVVRSDEEGTGNVRGRRQTGDTALVPLVVGEEVTSQIALSPDGRWLAYSSGPTGAREIYLAPFPGMSSRRIISRNGGTEPRWAHSGRELFYKSGNQFMVVEMTGPTLTPGSPRPLFSLAGYRAARNRQQYDVAPDDQRFVMIREVGTKASAEVVYVENWFEELEAKVNR